MNKYLEKIALNIGAARTMAKSVGVVPDHTSAWKYALRKLRDGKGNPLKGKSLGDAKVKLGDISNNSFQKIKSHTESNGGNQGVEFGGRVSDGKIGPIRKGDYGSVPFKEGDNFHTHPGVMRRVLDNKQSFLRSEPHRLSVPSGSERFNKAPKNLTRDLFNSNHELKNAETALPKADALFANKEKIIKDSYTNLQKNSPGEKISFKDQVERSHKLKALKNSISEPASDRVQTAFSNEHEINTSLKKLRADPQADTAVITHNVTDNKYSERIVAPTTNTVSSTKFRPQGLRTIYFDHTPRKAK